MLLLVSQMVQLLLVMSTESILLLLFIYLYFVLLMLLLVSQMVQLLLVMSTESILLLENRSLIIKYRINVRADPWNRAQCKIWETDRIPPAEA